MNIWDLVILLLVALAVFAAIRHIWKNRGHVCSGDCAGCVRAAGNSAGCSGSVQNFTEEKTEE